MRSFIVISRRSLVILNEVKNLITLALQLFCLCSQILHYVQDDRDRQNAET